MVNLNNIDSAHGNPSIFKWTEIQSDAKATQSKRHKYFSTTLERMEREKQKCIKYLVQKSSMARVINTTVF